MTIVSVMGGVKSFGLLALVSFPDTHGGSPSSYSEYTGFFPGMREFFASRSGPRKLGPIDSLTNLLHRIKINFR